MTDSSIKKRGLYAAICAFAIATLAFFANIDGTLSFFERISGNEEKQAASPSSSTPTIPPSNAANTPSSTSPPTTSEKPKEPEPGPLLIRLAIDSTSSLGKDKAAACTDEVRVFCVAVNNGVSNNLGELTSNCHLSWRLYRDDSTELLEKGAIQYCGKSNTIYLGSKSNPGAMLAGSYHLDASVELDDGTTGNTTYRFTLIDH